MIITSVLDSAGHFRTNVQNEELRHLIRDHRCTLWVDFEDASADENKILTDIFNFHPLAVEDCINTSEQPKLDNYDDYLFLVLHSVNFGRKQDEALTTIELNLFVGKNYVITHHRKPIRSIISNREICLRDPQALLGKGADFLLHKIVDAVVDNYLPIVSMIEHEIDSIEDDIFDNCTQKILNRILMLKKDATYLKKVIGQQRNTVYRLANTDFPLIGQDCKIYFSDINDQLSKFVDQLESYRDLLSGIVDLYLSMSSVKMNEIVKTLTIVMTILMPMTLITGVFGMNFDYMPPIHNRYGYFATIGGMALIGIFLWFYMKRKRWF